jgi:hypothetical protein
MLLVLVLDMEELIDNKAHQNFLIKNIDILNPKSLFLLV